jgi:uncharacterized protein involved in exopolysaccharide biosynthesis
MDIQTRVSTVGEEVSLADQMRALWHRKWLVLCVTVATTLIATVIVLLVPKEYEASVLCMPVSDSGSRGGFGGGLSSLTSQFGGLAALAGLSIGDSGKKSESIAVLQSEALTESYINQNRLLPILFWRKWDPKGLTWLETQPDKVPTLWKANEYFRKHVREVTTNTKTGLVTITITWTDPKVAATWANGIVSLTNEYLRSKAIRESERNIQYLNGEAERSNVVEVKQAIYSILQAEINKEMLARGTDEYALKVIDPAVPPELAAYPVRKLWVALGAVLGLLASAGFVIMRSGKS